MSKHTTVIISTGRNADPARRGLEEDLAAALQTRPNLGVAIVPHLYDLAPDGPGMQHLRSVEGDMIVLAWLYPRAAYWLLDANLIQGRIGSPLLPSAEAAGPTSQDRISGVPDRTIWCLDLRAYDQAKPLLEEIERIVADCPKKSVASVGLGKGADAGRRTSVEETTKFRWYPVIDYARCNNCLECLNFCLFGVFGLDESEQLLVEQPDACRDGCPACSRVCPSAAIIFPEHHAAVIAGDPTASSHGFNLELVQLFNTLSPIDLTAAERNRGLAEKTPADPSKTDESGEQDTLDDLVDHLDQMDL